MNELIAPPAPAPGVDVEGAGVFSSAKDLSAAIVATAPDPAQLAFNAADYGLDVLAVGMDPLGALTRAGVGFLLEHVWFLREPLDWLAGDPEQITTQAHTWHNASAALTSMAEDYPRAAATVTGWEGAAAGEYRGAVDDYAYHLRRAAGAAHDVSTEILMSGAAVATMRSLIRDIIADFISRAITKALVALAASFPTFGGSAIAFAISIGVEAAMLATDITRRIQRLLDVLAASAGRLRDAATIMERLRDVTIEAGKQVTEAEQDRRTWVAAG